MAQRLGSVARAAREEADCSLMDIATRAGVGQTSVHRFERGRGWSYKTDEIVAAYEHECQLEPGELWRRAINQD